MFIAQADQNTKSSGRSDMPPRWGLASLVAMFYKQVAPPGLGGRGKVRRWSITEIEQGSRRRPRGW